MGTEKGLIVPVIKDADHLTIEGIECEIGNFAKFSKLWIFVDEYLAEICSFCILCASGFGKILPFTIWPLWNRSGGYTGKVKRKGTYTGHVNIRMVVYLSKFKRFIGIPVTWRSRSILPDTAFGLRWYTGILLSCRYIPNTDTYSADWRRDDITSSEYCATSTRLPFVGSREYN